MSYVGIGSPNLSISNVQTLDKIDGIQATAGEIDGVISMDLINYVAGRTYFTQSIGSTSYSLGIINSNLSIINIYKDIIIDALVFEVTTSSAETNVELILAPLNEDFTLGEELARSSPILISTNGVKVVSIPDTIVQMGRYVVIAKADNSLGSLRCTSGFNTSGIFGYDPLNEALNFSIYNTTSLYVSSTEIALGTNGVSIKDVNAGGKPMIGVRVK